MATPSIAHPTDALVLSSAALDRPATAGEIRAQVNLIQEVMRAVMQDGVHFGVIPGTDKPTLYKAGAEKVLMTFRIAAQVGAMEDLSTPDEIRYRITVRGVSQSSGIVLGEGVGECSSGEEKYRWRRPVHPKEYEAAAEDRRREKWTKSGDTWHQVRTEPADVANTILKMAHKRALVAMTLVVTAASDVFTQDVEDLPEEMRDAAAAEGPATPSVQPPQRKSQKAAPAATAPADGVLRIVKVEPKSGTSKAGKAYTKFLITDSAGKTYTTFKADIAKLATECRDAQTQVEIAYESGAYGNDLTELRAVPMAGAEREPGEEG